MRWGQGDPPVETQVGRGHSQSHTHMSCGHSSLSLSTTVSGSRATGPRVAWKPSFWMPRCPGLGCEGP